MTRYSAGATTFSITALCRVAIQLYNNQHTTPSTNSRVSIMILTNNIQNYDSEHFDTHCNGIQHYDTYSLMVLSLIALSIISVSILTLNLITYSNDIQHGDTKHYNTQPNDTLQGHSAL
jgi:hypothetical protein